MILTGAGYYDTKCSHVSKTYKCAKSYVRSNINASCAL